MPLYEIPHIGLTYSFLRITACVKPFGICMKFHMLDIDIFHRPADLVCQLSIDKIFYSFDSENNV